MKKKYFTEEERLEAKRAYMKEYRAKYNKEHREKRLEQLARYRKNHKEEIARYNREHKAERAEYNAKWEQEHKAERAEYFAKRHAKYLNTKEGRARNLIRAHKLEDKKRGRGECDLTVPWFIKNIFETKCIYCGESDWKKLGCDRIDNNLPHTIENVVPACWDCNRKRHTKSFEEFYWELKHKKSLGNES